MKFIKFYMRDKRLDVTLPMEQAQQIMMSPQQMVMVTDSNGNWTGLTINKAEIKGTDHDWDKESYVFRENNLKLSEPVDVPDPKRSKEIREKISQMFKV